MEAELLVSQQSLGEETIKLTLSQEGMTIKPFHSPLEVKTINCPLDLSQDQYKAKITDDKHDTRSKFETLLKKIEQENTKIRDREYTKKHKVPTIFDSGASTHMFKDKKKLDGKYESIDHNVEAAGGYMFKATCMKHDSSLGKVIISPSLKMNLISTPQDDRKGY